MKPSFLLIDMAERQSRETVNFPLLPLPHSYIELLRTGSERYLHNPPQNWKKNKHTQKKQNNNSNVAPHLTAACK